MGWASERLSPLSEAFVAFAAGEALPVLDIGAAYGAASLAALKAGASVIANDLDDEHLQEISSRVPDNARGRLQLKSGSFPRGVHFDSRTLGAVHASNVFHFLTGRQLDEGMRAIAQWLRPGGKLFVQAATPYQTAFAPFMVEFERRIAAGEKWPGWIAKLSDYSVHRQRSNMPRAMHLLDDRTLRDFATEAGFEIERAWMYQRRDLSRDLRLDGRESVGLIAVKLDG